MWYIPVIDTVINELLMMSPVPVSFTNDMGEIRVKNAICTGRYWYGNNLSKSKTKPHIKILDSLDKDAKIATLLHEISHAKCHKKGCDCHTLIDKSKAEIHAYEYTLKWLLKNKRKKILRGEMKLIRNNLDRMDHYGKASKYIVESELWQKCLKYIGRLK